MFRIRHYDELFYPSKFSKGFLGWKIRTLNWLRWKLEVYIQRNVVKYLCKEGFLPKQKVKSTLQKFDLDVEREKLSAKETKVLPFSEISAFTLEKDLTSVSPIKRPEPITSLIARYGNNKRSKRYARGRTNYLVWDETDFEGANSS